MSEVPEHQYCHKCGQEIHWTGMGGVCVRCTREQAQRDELARLREENERLKPAREAPKEPDPLAYAHWLEGELRAAREDLCDALMPRVRLRELLARIVAILTRRGWFSDKDDSLTLPGDARNDLYEVICTLQRELGLDEDCIHPDLSDDTPIMGGTPGWQVVTAQNWGDGVLPGAGDDVVLTGFTAVHDMLMDPTYHVRNATANLKGELAAASEVVCMVQSLCRSERRSWNLTALQTARREVRKVRRKLRRVRKLLTLPGGTEPLYYCVMARNVARAWSICEDA